MRARVVFADRSARFGAVYTVRSPFLFSSVVPSTVSPADKDPRFVNQDQAKLDIRFAGPNVARPRPAVLQPGMVLAFEPNACIGDHRVNIGGTVIVTATGCEELNQIPTSVTHKQ